LRADLQNTPLFFNVPCVCPEPVLADIRVSVHNGAKEGVSRTLHQLPLAADILFICTGIGVLSFPDAACPEPVLANHRFFSFPQRFQIR
jgi:hypothetical protein